MSGIFGGFLAVSSQTDPLVQLLGYTGGTRSIILDPSDLTSLRKTANGRAQVSANDDTCGMVIDKAQSAGYSSVGDYIAAQTPIYQHDFSSTDSWSLGGGIAITGGELVFTASGNLANRTLTGQTNLRLYLVEIVVTSYGGSDDLKVRLNQGTFSNFSLTGAGTYYAIIRAGSTGSDLDLIAGTTSVSAAVTSIKVSEIGRAAAISNSTEEPLWKSSGSQLDFDTSNDRLRLQIPAAFSSDCSVGIVFEHDGGDFMMMFDGPGGGEWLGLGVNGSGSDTDNGISGATTYVNGTIVGDGTPTRNEMYDAVATSTATFYEARNVDLSGMAVPTFGAWGSGFDHVKKIKAIYILDNTDLGGNASAALTAAQAWANQRKAA